MAFSITPELPFIILNTSSRLRWTVYVARMGEMRNTYKILVRKREGKRPLGRPTRRWEDNKMDLKEGKVWSGCIWLRIGTSGKLL
jgi:hypothetical protein